jgi:hypothetical protein
MQPQNRNNFPGSDGRTMTAALRHFTRPGGRAPESRSGRSSRRWPSSLPHKYVALGGWQAAPQACRASLFAFAADVDAKRLQQTLASLVVFLLVGSFALACHGTPASAAADNLLVNSDFSEMFEGKPNLWNVSHSARFQPTGGPDDKPSIVFRKGDRLDASQYGLRLAEGERYKLRMDITGNGMKAEISASLTSRAASRVKSEPQRIRFGGVPATCPWTTFESEFIAPPSLTGDYQISLSAKLTSGEMRIANVRLEAATPDGITASYNAFRRTSRILIPHTPLLNHIPLERPMLSLAVGEVADGEYDCLYSAGSLGEKRVRIERGGGDVCLDLHGLPAGDHKLRLAMVDRQSGKHLEDSEYGITLVSYEMDTSKHRRLNNLTTELLNEPVKSDATVQFTNPREGWVFIAVPKGASATLNGTDHIVTPDFPAVAEAVRFLPAGEHNLAVSGRDGMVIARAIPQILYCAVSTHWPTYRKFLMSAGTTILGTRNRLAAAECSEMDRLGLLRPGNISITLGDSRHTLEDVASRYMKNNAWTNPEIPGFSVDEYGWGWIAELNIHAQVLRKLDERKFCLTWGPGGPKGKSAVYTDILSSMINSGRGRGGMLSELYSSQPPTEQEAWDRINSWFSQTARMGQPSFKDSHKHLTIAINPARAFEEHTFADHKAHLDLQMNVLANNPDLKDLGGVGYWGIHYAEDEMRRWSCRLMRHYVIEGKTGMLSTQYGFTYLVDHLTNGDFDGGLDGWKAEDATAEAFPGFGKKYGNRRTGAFGNTICLLKKNHGEIASIRQTARGLKPGTIYKLKYVTSDRKDLALPRRLKQDFGIECRLSAGEIIPAKCHVLRDFPGSAELAKVNHTFIIFRATSPETDVTFTNAQAEDGAEPLINFIQIKPYYDEEVNEDQ